MSTKGQHAPRAYDKGPWHANPSGSFVYSDDFSMDVALNLSGDFENEKQRKEYANWMARSLTTHDELLENLQGCMEALASYAPDCIEVTSAKAAIAKALGE